MVLKNHYTIGGLYCAPSEITVVNSDFVKKWERSL